MLLATKVGKTMTNTHARKDGTGEFTSQSTPIEFHGFEMDPDTGFITVDWTIKHTLWTSDTEVIAEAGVSNWNNSQSGFVLCLDPRNTKIGDKGLHKHEYKTESGEVKSVLQRSIWIVGDATWDFIARPVSSDRGNLAQARAKAGLPARIDTPAPTINLSDKPFG